MEVYFRAEVDNSPLLCIRHLHDFGSLELASKLRHFVCSACYQTTGFSLLGSWCGRWVRTYEPMEDLEDYEDGSVEVLDTDQHNTIWANHSGHCRLGCAVCTGDDSSESREGVATRRRGACRTLPCPATNDLWCVMAFHVGVFAARRSCRCVLSLLSVTSRWHMCCPVFSTGEDPDQARCPVHVPFCVVHLC